MWYFEETVDNGVGRTMPVRGAVSGCFPLACHGWPIWETVSIVFFILLKIHGYHWQGAGVTRSVPSSTVTGLELRGQGPHML